MMKHRALVTVMLVAALVFAASCKKSEETTEYKFFSGSFTLPYPAYVLPGYEKQFNLDTLTTLKLEDGSTSPIGYYVYDTNTGVTDTLVRGDGTVLKKVFTTKASEELGVYTFVMAAYSDGYSSESLTVTFTVVRPGLNGTASLTDFSIKSDDKTFTDPRDRRTYYYSTVGGVDWMRQNLAWKGAGKPLEESDAASDVFGRFYTHAEAMKACPEGWSLPAENDWLNLAAALGKNARYGEDIPDLAGMLMEKVKFNGSVMWEYWPQVKIDNAARFSALPVGYASVAGRKYKFSNYGEYAMFWSEDEYVDMASFRYIYEDKPYIFYGEAPAEYTAMPVRCIRK